MTLHAVVLLEVFSDIHYLVLEMRGVEVQTPGDIAGLDDITGQFQFNTLVQHITDVVVAACIAGGVGSIDEAEHVGGLAGEELYASTQTGLEEFELNTGIEIVIGLPCDVGITFRSERKSQVSVVLNGIGVHVEEVTDVVVSLLTEGSLQFEHVNPGDILQPLFLVHNPGSTYGEEITPAVIGMKTGGSIAAEGYGTEVTLPEVVLPTQEITLVVVAAGRITVVDDLDGTAQILVLEVGGHAGTCSKEVVVGGTVVLVAGHGFHVVLAKVLAVVEELLEVVGIGLAHLFVYLSVRTGDGTETIEGLLGQRALGVACRGRAVQGEFQTVIEVEVHVAVGGKGVLSIEVAVEKVLLERVALRNDRAHQSVHSSVTIVVHASVAVRHDVPVAVAQIDGEDGGYMAHGSKDVGVVGGTHVVVVRVAEGGVGTQFHPFLGLIVSLQARRVAFVVGVLHHAFVAEVAQAGIELRTGVAAVDIEVVLLAETVAEGFFLPIVGIDGVYLSVVVDAVAKGSVGIESAVLTDEVFSLGHGVADIAEATLTLLVAVQDGVGFVMGIKVTEAHLLGLVIVEGLVIGLIILAWVIDGLVVTLYAACRTPFGIQRHLSLSALGLLRGNHDDTIGTTGSIEGIAGCILEDADRGHIVGIQVVPTSIVGSTIYDDKRGVACIDGAETSDADGGS